MERHALHTVRAAAGDEEGEGGDVNGFDLPVRFSHLKAYGKSALHGHHARTAAEDDPTQSMERGTAVHAILFGNKKVCGYPGKVRNGKQFEAFCAEHADHEILTMADFDKARRMADAVQAHKLAWPLLQGVQEETLLFRWNGINCRSTPDVRGADFITELKSGATCDPARFVWHSLRMQYHAQMAMESIAFARKNSGARPADCFIVAVEQSPPHAVQVYRLEDRALQAGEKLLMLWSERLKVCEASGSFPAYTETVMPLDVPDEEEELVFSDDGPPARGTAFDYATQA